MRFILLFALFFICLSSYGQKFKADQDLVSDYKDGHPQYFLDTIANSTLSKKQLYSNALSYLTRSFNDSRSVVERKDLELGEISFKALISSNFEKKNESSVNKSVTSKDLKQRIELHFKCTIYFKENKFKIVLNNLKWSTPLGLKSESYFALRTDDPEWASQQNLLCRNMAIELIKELTNNVGKNPINEF